MRITNPLQIAVNTFHPHSKYLSKKQNYHTTNLDPLVIIGIIEVILNLNVYKRRVIVIKCPLKKYYN